jgi:hypothetical protein
MDKNQSAQAEAVKREMYRKSQDLIRVYNPTSEDYTLDWDKFKHIVPHKDKDMGWGKGQRVMYRYLAEKYVREIKNKLINEMADGSVQKMLEGMAEVSRTEFLADPYMKQKLYDKAPRTDNTELIRKIYKICWLGVEEEFGLIDTPEVEGDGVVDRRPIEEQILDEMERPAKKIEEVQIVKEPEATYPINKNKKKEILKEVSQ